MGHTDAEFYEGLAALHAARDTREDPADAKELNVLDDALARYGEPALEIGCGRGRFLLELRERGYEIDGCDLSLELLVRCTEQALERSLPVDLYWQSMQELDLPRRYMTILVPSGAFLHLVDRGEALDALRRIHRHLLPGGALMLVLRLGSDPDNAYQLPGGWRHVEEIPQGQSDTTLVVEERKLPDAPLDQLTTTQRRYRLYVGDHMIHEETRSAAYRCYGKYELSIMLAWAGFWSIDVQPFSAVTSGTSRQPSQMPMLVTALRRGPTERHTRSEHILVKVN